MLIPRFSDWHELVVENEWNDVEKLIAEYPELFSPYPRKEPAIQKQLFPPPSLYFDKNAEKLATMFESSTSIGLSDLNINKFREVYGENVLPVPKRDSIFAMIWKQLTDMMVIILIIVAVVEAAMGEGSTSIILAAVVFFNVFVGTYQEFKAGLALQALLTLSVPKVYKHLNPGIQKSP